MEIFALIVAICIYAFFGFIILALVAMLLGYGRHKAVSNNNFTHQNETPRGGHALYYLEIGFLEAVRGTTRTVHFLGTPPVDINVPPNTSSGYAVHVPGRGGEGGDGLPLDALIKITVKPHPRFERRGLDIFLDAWASARDLAAGTTIDVETLDGSAKVRIKKGTKSGQILRLPGKGVTCSNTGSRGHQLVRVLAREEATRLGERADPWQTAHAEQSAPPHQTANKAQSRQDSARWRTMLSKKNSGTSFSTERALIASVSHPTG
jgi:DnaJ-class molecular chaperone